jgi:hydrogenase-4 component E
VRVATPYLGTAPALIICGILTIISFYVMTPIAASNPLPTADAIPLAFAGVLIGFFIMVNRRRAVTQILGFLMLARYLLPPWRRTAPFIVEMGFFSTCWCVDREVFVYPSRII